MSKFLDILKEKIIEKAMTLPYLEGTERLITIQCTKAYKNKLENEMTNECLTITSTSNHSKLPVEFQICGIYIRLNIDEQYTEPKFQVEYYKLENNEL